MKLLLTFIFLAFCHFQLNGQIFTQSRTARSMYQVEAGYQSGSFVTPSKLIVPKTTNANGVFILFRQYPGILYLSFGKTSDNSSSLEYILAGLEYPAFIFPNSTGRNEYGILISGITDYAKWRRQTDFFLPRFEVSSFGVLLTGYYRNVQKQFEFHARVSGGYAFAYQYFGSQNGTQAVARGSLHLVFPDLVDEFGLSVSVFSNISRWQFDSDELTTLTQQTAASIGIAF